VLCVWQDPESDLCAELMGFKSQLCLAQAQECILEKSILDNRKPLIISKVSRCNFKPKTLRLPLKLTIISRKKVIFCDRFVKDPPTVNRAYLMGPARFPFCVCVPFCEGTGTGCRLKVKFSVVDPDPEFHVNLVPDPAGIG
jgi:hypothetical protein